MSGPLEGVRIIDMTAVILGPYATQILGDLGAEVIKVEPQKGDVLRWNGPSRSPGMGPVFLHLNRSKRSIVLDLKQKAGRDAVLKLIKTADVLMYNIRPKSMGRLDLTYEEVKKINPRIIYCGAYGYAENGPYAGKPAYDDLIQGAVALPAMEAKIGGEPRYLPTSIADRTVGLTAAYTMLAALFHRERTGRGQSVEIPMFEVMAESTLTTHMYGLTFDPPIGDAGYKRLFAPERRPYKTKDGYVCALPYTDKHWQAFFDLIDRPDLKADPRFINMNSRTKHIRELYVYVIEAMLTKTSAEWLELLDKADIPSMPMHTLESLIEDPHLNQTGFFSWIDHPTEGKIHSMAIPTQWSDSKPEVKYQAPRLGQHSREILKEIGYTDAEIEKLVADNVTVEAGKVGKGSQPKAKKA